MLGLCLCLFPLNILPLLLLLSSSPLSLSPLLPLHCRSCCRTQHQHRRRCCRCRHCLCRHHLHCHCRHHRSRHCCCHSCRHRIRIRGHGSLPQAHRCPWWLTVVSAVMEEAHLLVRMLVTRARPSSLSAMTMTRMMTEMIFNF